MNRVIEIYLSTSCSSDNFLGSENRSVDEAVNEQGKKKKKKKRKKKKKKEKKDYIALFFKDLNGERIILTGGTKRFLRLVRAIDPFSLEYLDGKERKKGEKTEKKKKKIRKRVQGRLFLIVRPRCIFRLFEIRVIFLTDEIFRATRLSTNIPYYRVSSSKQLFSTLARKLKEKTKQLFEYVLFALQKDVYTLVPIRVLLTNHVFIPCDQVNYLYC